MRAIAGAAALALAASAPVRAEVVARTDHGFAIVHSVRVPADAERSWRELVRPANWWSSAHSWSGDAANLSLEPRLGGCFCEKLPPAKGARGTLEGAAEHMRVIYAAPGRMLRLTGALGPLQAEALQGTMTWTLAPADGETSIKLEYVVGGYMRLRSEQIAPAVNAVLGEQLARLAARLGVRRATTAPQK